MGVRDTSQMMFNAITAGADSKAGSVKNRLRDKVYAVIVEHGPVHNLRLLEILQQKEKQKKKADRIEWTPSNAWPRVTEMVAGGGVYDLGSFRGIWRGKKKTLHFWSVLGQSQEMSPGWEKVKLKPSPPKKKTSPGVPAGAQQKHFFRSE